MTDTLQLDGRAVPIQPGQTVMEVAQVAGVYIPHLCHHPALAPVGSCRLCTVEVDGRRAAACTLPARPGMVVNSASAALNADRRELTRLLFAEGNHVCPGCERSGNCQLQAVAYHLDMEEPWQAPLYPRRQLDASHPEVLLERDRCIQCGLCVRASQALDGKNVFTLAGRGLATTLLVNSPSGLLGDSDISAQDRAVQVCPVGALLVRGHGFERPIGQRIYDAGDISQVGHHNPQEQAP